MFTRVYKTLIGKDIARTSSAVLFPTSAAAQNVAIGEIFVLDQNKVMASAGLTYQDSPVIYIAQVSSDTVSYVDKATSPNSLSGYRLIISDAIEGKRVMSYVGRPFQSTASTVIKFTITTPTLAREYVLRVFYKDIPEHPGQFTQTFRVIATDTSTSTLGALFMAKINGYAPTRCTASFTDPTLTLTFNLPTSSTSTLDDIDEFQLPYGDAFFDYVDTSSTASYGQAAWVTAGFTKVVTPGIIGYGNWYQVRDAEKWALPNRGVINRTLFPVIKPEWFTVKSAQYNEITIEHDKLVRTSALQEQKSAILTTRIFFPINASQATTVLGVLNPWMNSTPSMIEPITNF